MAEVDRLKGALSAPLTHIGGHKMVTETVLDFAGVERFSGPVTGADNILAIPLPANAIVTNVSAECLVAEGGVVTFAVGDSADPDGWILALDGNVETAGILVPADGAYAATGKRYGGNGVIWVTPSADVDAGRIHVFVEFHVREL